MAASNHPSKAVALIGYSGHAYVVYDILKAQHYPVKAYCDLFYKEKNPYQLLYLGMPSEEATQQALQDYDYFICIGDNQLRKENYQALSKVLPPPILAIHPQSWISPSAQLKAGTMVGTGVSIQAFCKIGQGVICNTQASIDHECIIGDFCHVAPQATLCGNVQIGEGCLIGANAVIKPGIQIGAQSIVGAGAVVIDHVPPYSKVGGNPARIL